MKIPLVAFLYSKLPFLISILDPIRRKQFKNRYESSSIESIFADIYKTNRWGSAESRSGLGSELIQTETIREKLPEFFRELHITSLLDIPCGDFNWLKEVDLNFLSYIGADIVGYVIFNNNENYLKKNRNFLKLDILKDDLPKVDLILCRDLFIHFSFNDIFKSLDNIKKSGSKYLLTTSYPSIKTNHDILSGQWHPLNLLMPPFCFPKPLKFIDEKNLEKGIPNKHLLLWKSADL